MPKKQLPRTVFLPTQNLPELIGDRGEKIFELAITDRELFPSALFRLAFLGAKWPAIDYYVELRNVRGATPFFFVQIKATAQPFAANADELEINLDKRKYEQLIKIPGPTYLAGVHEPTKKTYILSIHNSTPQGIYRIPLKYELTPANLKALYDEVCAFWKSHPTKPVRSHFQ